DCAGSRWLRSRVGVEAPPAVLWSPDSRRILTHRIDQSDVPYLHLTESAPADGARPRLHGYRYAMPGDTIPSGTWLIIDLPSRTPVPPSAEPFPFPWVSPIRYRKAWWSPDGTVVYCLDQPRDPRTLRLLAIDAAGGEVRTLIEENAPTRV